MEQEYLSQRQNHQTQPATTLASQHKQQKKNTPDQELLERNSKELQKEIDWLVTIIRARLERTSPEQEIKPVYEIVPLPELAQSGYRELLQQQEYDYLERLLLILAFVAEYRSRTLSLLFDDTKETPYYFHDYGGIRNKNGRFIPTLQTALFILAGNDNLLGAHYKAQLTEKHPLFTTQVMGLYYPEHQLLPYADPVLVLNREYSHYMVNSIQPRLDYGIHFPAELLETEKSFDDLILDEYTHEKLMSVMDFIKYSQQLYAESDIGRKVSPGYVVLFYGQPGTGKSMAASLLGKACNVPVYKINLARIISKYIGETEKNLEQVFSRLEGKHVILFFDEADALFGKRTEIVDAKDRYANQEVSYLLQRIEQWNGVVILATNNQNNFDEAFQRRIMQQIPFILPKSYELYKKLWYNHLPNTFSFESEELLQRLCQHYYFTGGMIALVMKRASIAAKAQESPTITGEILNPILKDISLNDRNIQFRPV